MININDIDSVTLFWYIIIFFATIYAFSRIEIKLSVVYGTFIVILVLYALNDNYVKTKNTINDMLHTKNNTISPKPERIGNYNDIVNCLFSIQDLYVYNPQAYEDMIQYIDDFFVYYEEVLNNNSLAGVHYEVLNDRRRLILNSLQSIIYNLPVNVQYTKKLNDSVTIINQLLQKYLYNIKKINDNNIYKNGYTTHTKIIHVNDDVVPYNTFVTDNTASFDIY
jgi:hypothetical protein